MGCTHRSQSASFVMVCLYLVLRSRRRRLGSATCTPRGVCKAINKETSVFYRLLISKGRTHCCHRNEWRIVCGENLVWTATILAMCYFKWDYYNSTLPDARAALDPWIFEKGGFPILPLPPTNFEHPQMKVSFPCDMSIPPGSANCRVRRHIQLNKCVELGWFEKHF